MWIKLDPTKLWGRPVQYNNYERFNITLDKGIDDGVANKKLGTCEASSKRLRYGNGLFYIFKTKAKNIKFKYKFHHSDKDDYASSRQSVIEPQLCGKLKNSNIWIMLNKSHLLDATYPKIAEKDWIVEYNLTEDFDEFQFCLPFGNIFYYIFMETNESFELISPTNIVFGFLGSSVTNMSGCYACDSLSSQLYRELKINSCNLAIPISNSIVYKKILDFVKNNSQIKWYILDTINTCNKNIENAKNLNIKFACVNCRWNKYKFDVNYIFDFIKPSYNRDHMHLTGAGVIAFIEKLLPILNKEIQNEKSSNN